MIRTDGRRVGQSREVTFELDAAPMAEGSCLISTGNTRVLCTASVEEGVPRWRADHGTGWVTAEYAMLPRATNTRTQRERRGPTGRTQEIQRLIGRSLRSVVDMEMLGERTVLLDCDVLQADGGTRTAGITGAAVALFSALDGLIRKGILEKNPMRQMVAAVSVGIVDGTPMVDLDYGEDVSAQVDMNLVGTESGDLIEIQGTAEGHPFSKEELDSLVDLGMAGIGRLIDIQRQVLGG